jgi:hypothetical protein
MPIFIWHFARLFVPFTFGEGRLQLRKTQINLVFHSFCTTFAGKIKKKEDEEICNSRFGDLNNGLLRREKVSY